jgi:hypothetical protein
VNSRDRNFTPTKIDRRIEQIEESVQRYLEALETADRTQPVEAEAKAKRLTRKIDRLRQRVRELGKLKEQLQARDDPQVSTTDPAIPRTRRSAAASRATTWRAAAGWRIRLSLGRRDLAAVSPRQSVAAVLKEPVDVVMMGHSGSSSARRTVCTWHSVEASPSTPGHRLWRGPPEPEGSDAGVPG